jgi:hypothetical protein
MDAEVGEICVVRRVFVGRDRRTYPESGLPDSHDPVWHLSTNA